MLALFCYRKDCRSIIMVHFFAVKEVFLFMSELNNHHQLLLLLALLTFKVNFDCFVFVFLNSVYVNPGIVIHF